MTWTYGMLSAADRQFGPAISAEIEFLLRRLSDRHTRNKLRADYYDMHNLFRDLGISLPPNLRNLEVAMGWPAKAVDQLARRVRMQGWVLPTGDLDSWGVDELWTDNAMPLEAPQAQVSALIHSTGFVLTHLAEDGVKFHVLDAYDATGRWDARRHGLGSGLAVLSRDQDSNEPTSVLFLSPLAYALFTYQPASRSWAVQVQKHDVGRVTMEAITYRPRLGRPFGSSRISRAVMAITDSAMRTVVRSEVGAEFYSVPQRYILGADESQFVSPTGQRKTTWDLVMGRILTLPDASDFDAAKNGRAEVGTFPQITMQPHTEQLRQWAQLFAAETSLPVGALGIVQDNPSSAEAIYAAKEELLLEAEDCAAGFGTAWTRAMQSAVMLRDGLTDLPADLRGLSVRWMDPSTPSRAAATDAVMKQVQAGVLPADSRVALEQLGYDQPTIERIMNDRRAAAGTSGTALLAQALQRQTAPTGQTPSPSPGVNASEEKAKFDALGIAIRAGVSPESAAARLGLGEIAFTGAVPVSLRLPEQDAKVLEEG